MTHNIKWVHNHSTKQAHQKKIGIQELTLNPYQLAKKQQQNLEGGKRKTKRKPTSNEVL